jgi:6-phosphogluconolactonase
VINHTDMQLHIHKNPEELSQALAVWILELMEQTLAIQDRFCWVLSGGNTPKALYQLLASPAYNGKVPWSKLHIFWGDERYVPFGDPRNNARMAYDCLLDRVAIPPAHIHVMRTDVEAQLSATQYEQTLRHYFPTPAAGPPSNTFDLVLLGMGEDGHTLSLFPGTDVIHEETKWVCAYYLKSQDMDRITLTKKVVNRSTHVVFLATGSDKAQALHSVLQGPADPARFPAQVIKPEHGQLDWFVDLAAAAELG